MGHRLAILNVSRPQVVPEWSNKVGEIKENAGGIKKEFDSMCKDFDIYKKVLSTIYIGQATNAMKLANDQLSNEQIDNLFF